MTVGAVLAETQPGTLVAVVDREALVAEFGVEHIMTVRRVFGFLKHLAVVAVFAVLRGIGEVTVFGIRCPGGVFAVFVPYSDERHARYGFVQFRPLVEKRAGKIVRPTILHGIKRIALPFV